jgi:predicted Zn-dependent peptidase
MALKGTSLRSKSE